MIQYQGEMRRYIDQIIPFEGHCYIQKIYSSSTLICLSVRFRGETLFLYIGRGNGVEGFWVAKEKIPAELRRMDRFLEYIRKHLGASELLYIYQIFNDRCIQIIYQKYGRRNSFVFFWKGRKLYFLNYFFDFKSQKFNLMKSWGDKRVVQEEIPLDDLYHDLFEIGLNENWKGDARVSETSIPEIIDNEKRKLLKINRSSRDYKFLIRKRDKICRDLDRIESAVLLQEMLISGKINLDNIGDVFTFENFKVKLQGNINCFQKKDRIFEKIKSYKKSKKFLEKRKIYIQNEIDIFDKLRKGIDINDCFLSQSYPKKLKIVEPYWIFPIRRVEENGVDKAKTDFLFRVFQFKDGVSFAIGLDSRGNDFLRTKWGHSDDWWFHLDGYPGPHLIAKTQDLSGKLDKSMFDIIASALRDYANLDIREVPVVFTRLKNVKGVKGSRGKVIYRREKYMKMIYDKDWKDKSEKESM